MVITDFTTLAAQLAIGLGQCCHEARLFSVEPKHAVSNSEGMRTVEMDLPPHRLNIMHQQYRYRLRQHRRMDGGKTNDRACLPIPDPGRPEYALLRSVAGGREWPVVAVGLSRVKFQRGG